MAKKEPTQKKEEKFVERKYVCARWPFLRLNNGVRFERGILIATSQATVDMVERNEQFGGAIKRVFEKVSKNDESGATAMEQKIINDLEANEPGVRRGAISTSSLRGQ